MSNSWTSKRDPDDDVIGLFPSGEENFVALFSDTKENRGVYLDAEDTLAAAQHLLKLLNAKTGSDWNAWNGSSSYAALVQQRESAAVNECKALAARVAELEGQAATVKDSIDYRPRVKVNLDTDNVSVHVHRLPTGDVEITVSEREYSYD